jgi:hypothetical protein
MARFGRTPDDMRRPLGDHRAMTITHAAHPAPGHERRAVRGTVVARAAAAAIAVTAFALATAVARDSDSASPEGTALV